MKDPVSIKGTREGLTITLGDSAWPQVIEDLSRHLQMQGAFFRGGRVALEAGDRAIEQEQLSQLHLLLQQHDMILRTVVASNALAQASCQELGLRLVATATEVAKAPAQAEFPIETTMRTQRQRSSMLEGSKGLLVHHLVRSGQVLRHTGHIAIIGDVHAGGEVIAGGDIVIWGRLHGLAHAGSMGDDSAIVCALRMNPSLLRIAKLVGRPEEDGGNHARGPEIAHIRDEVIIVEPWDRAARRMR